MRSVALILGLILAGCATPAPQAASVILWDGTGLHCDQLVAIPASVTCLDPPARTWSWGRIAEILWWPKGPVGR